MRFGVIGAGGYWGPNWVRVLKQLNCLAAVCDRDAERLAKVVERFSLKAGECAILASHEELLKQDLDGVFVVTPPSTHADLAVEAMRAGKHVFVEKPLAVNLEQCYRVKFEAQRLGRVVMVGHTFIYHAAVRRFKESLPMVGNLRTLYTVRANFGQYQEDGLINDLLPHDLSIFNFLCGSFPTSVSAAVNRNQDVAFVTAQYGPITCNAFLSWGYPDKTRKLAAIGDKGILEWDLSKTHLLFHKKWAQSQPGGRFRHFDEGTQNIMVYDQSEPLTVEALHFQDCISEGKEPITGIEDGINVVKGLEACR
jgi:UDP-2-acetamido-3-amino-2,3-dideoxy-glucuronate N-acetyltransferase